MENVIEDYHWTGVFKYKKKLSAIVKNLPLDLDIHKTKKNINCHLKSQLNKSRIVDIENKGRDNIKDNNAAARQ